MEISYQSAEEQQKNMLKTLSEPLLNLDKVLSKKKEKDGLPFYLTKWRIKSVDSIYLKTKRKKINSFEDITDYGGFRILCMFNQDISHIHSFLVEYIKNTSDMKLKELTHYNFNDEKTSRVLDDVVESSLNYTVKTKWLITPSGYKSLHYLVEFNGVDCIEIQLRTILQDVWGELSHALAYKKGRIHTHIVNSFSLLARDLDTNDLLLSNLKDISDKEQTTLIYSSKEKGPYNIFCYEDNMIPEAFNDRESELYNSYRKYNELLDQLSDEGIDKAKLLDECEKQLNIIDDSTSRTEKGNIIYWIDMEKAYLKFCRGEKDEALELYNSLINTNFSERYVPYFRKGEILFLRGEIEKALMNFDQSEQWLPSDINPRNKYLLKVKLANTYWQLGLEYIGIIQQKILEAEDIFSNHYGKDEIFNKTDYYRLLNNLCWYQLEDFLVTKERLEHQNRNKREYPAKIRDKTSDELNDKLERLKQRYKKLKEEVLVNDDPSSNSIDTAAWACFQLALHRSDDDLLDEARAHCQRAIKVRDNHATHKILSADLHRNHFQEIMNTAAPLSHE